MSGVHGVRDTFEDDGTADLRYLFATPAPPDWEAGGALCLQVGPEAFDVPSRHDASEARRICVRCPMQQACREYADSIDASFGIWGGLTVMERRAGAPLPEEAPWEPPAARPEPSRVKGVSWSTREGRWAVKVTLSSGQRRAGGYYTSQAEAERVALELSTDEGSTA